jgi:hypothetical protein
VGVVDLVAVSETTLLVLERGVVDGQGNTVRLFSVSLESAQDISGEPTLGAADLVPLAEDTRPGSRRLPSGWRPDPARGELGGGG